MGKKLLVLLNLFLLVGSIYALSTNYYKKESAVYPGIVISSPCVSCESECENLGYKYHGEINKNLCACWGE